MILNKIFNYEYNNVKRMIHNLRGKLIALIFISSFILIPIQTSAEEDYLIVRIVDVDSAPKPSKNIEQNLTLFTIFISYQTVNPTSSEIIIDYSCAPLPFPYLRTNLRDKNLKVRLRYYYQWIAGDTTIPPGTRNASKYFSFDVLDYVNTSLPLGTYEIWYDYTNCSSSPVPVITEKLYLDVTETSIIYYFDYNNETRIVSTLHQTNYIEPLLIISIVLITTISRKKNQRKRSI
jgi:hypothetical protein